MGAHNIAAGGKIAQKTAAHMLHHIRTSTMGPDIVLTTIPTGARTPKLATDRGAVKAVAAIAAESGDARKGGIRFSNR